MEKLGDLYGKLDGTAAAAWEWALATTQLIINC
jgi:hypothetical protein